MNDEINQIEKLLNIASDGDLGDSYHFYNELFRKLLTNIAIVDSRTFNNVNVYICDMDVAEFEKYEENIQSLKISGFQAKEFFSR